MSGTTVENGARHRGRRGRRCALIAAAITLSAAAEEGPAWHGERYPDPFSDSGMIVKAESAARSGDAMLRALVRCWTSDGALDARFLISGSPALSGSVGWQFDGSPAREARWEVNPRGTQVVVPLEREGRFLESMRQRFVLELRLDVADGSELRFTMPLTGSQRAIGQVVEACGG